MGIEGGTQRHIDYDPWGNPTGAVTGERQTFNCQERDRENAFFDLSDRNYDPNLGRFVRPDRLWEKERALSPYHYCANNPERLTDPSGMQTNSLVVKVYGEGGGGGTMVGGGMTMAQPEFFTPPSGFDPLVFAGPGIGITVVLAIAEHEINKQPGSHGAAMAPAATATHTIVSTKLGEGLLKATMGLGSTFHVSGSKSAEELEKHINGLAGGRGLVDELLGELGNAKGPKKREPLIEQLKKAVKSIEGHLKEIQQKWYNGEDFQPPKGYDGPAPDLSRPNIKIPNM